MNRTNQWAYVLLAIGAQCIPVAAFCQSRAHEKSAFARIDPFYNSVHISPPSQVRNGGASWIYGTSELECWRLQLLRQRKDSAHLMVGYPGNFHKPFSSASFRLECKKPIHLDSLVYRAVGHGTVYINNTPVGTSRADTARQTIRFTTPLQVSSLQFDLTTAHEPPALLVENPSVLSTSNPDWKWKTGNQFWESVSPYPQNTSSVPPHILEDPIQSLQPVAASQGLYDFGRELYGYLQVTSTEAPRLTVGESRKEALDTACTLKEQPLKFEQTARHKWRSAYPAAFRYVYASPLTSRVQCDAIVYPTLYRGAFACSDSTLTRIWMHSAYTLRLCMHDFLLDGIKRDRLPWTGDLVMSMLVNAYSFADAELARRSLVALGRAGIHEKDINGIIDYSLWWLIAQDQYQLYFADHTHLVHEWKRIKAALDVLAARCDANGFLPVRDTDWLFIDWVDQKKWTALQMLWWWAQQSGARLAQRIGDHQTAKQWQKRAEKLQKKLYQVAWDPKEKVWLADLNAPGNKTRHPNFLSLVSGMLDPAKHPEVQAFLQSNSASMVGTPYMAGFENIALAQFGNVEAMLSYIRTYWGGMLNQGATTFWEAYNPADTEETQYAFYDRPYGKSLCHAWSAGPVALLSAHVLGLQPLEDGWKRFTIHPRLGSLSWASVCVPTPYGNIALDRTGTKMSLTIPPGTTLQWNGKAIQGPCVLTDLDIH